VPHFLVNGYKNVLAICISTDYSFPLADKVKHAIANPGANAAPAAAGGAAKAAAPVVEEEEEEEEDAGFDLFD
jgi:hypothetical protein